MIRLYGYWRSSAAYRVRIALALKGVACEPVEIDLLNGEQRGAAWRARNPQGLAQALVIAADIHPIDNPRVLARLAEQFGADRAAKDDWYRHWIAEGFAALEAMAGDGAFLGGDAPGLADICLVPQIYNARRFALPLDAYPRLVAADAAAQALPAFAAAPPDRVRPA